jgi:hypothetical protein
MMGVDHMPKFIIERTLGGAGALSSAAAVNQVRSRIDATTAEV